MAEGVGAQGVVLGAEVEGAAVFGVAEAVGVDGGKYK